MFLTPRGKLGVPGEQDAVLLQGKVQQQGILFGISFFKPVGTYRIVSHEPEIPAQCAQHAVSDEL